MKLFSSALLTQQQWGWGEGDRRVHQPEEVHGENCPPYHPTELDAAGDRQFGIGALHFMLALELEQRFR